ELRRERSQCRPRCPDAAPNHGAGRRHIGSVVPLTMEDSTMTGSTARDDSHAGETSGTEVSVVIPAGLDHLPIPRRIAATLAATLDFDIDAVADLRMAVDEMVSTVVQRARPGAAVTTVFRAGPDSV